MGGGGGGAKNGDRKQGLQFNHTLLVPCTQNLGYLDLGLTKTIAMAWSVLFRNTTKCLSIEVAERA